MCRNPEYSKQSWFGQLSLTYFSMQSNVLHCFSFSYFKLSKDVSQSLYNRAIQMCFLENVTLRGIVLQQQLNTLYNIALFPFPLTILLLDIVSIVYK